MRQRWRRFVEKLCNVLQSIPFRWSISSIFRASCSQRYGGYLFYFLVGCHETVCNRRIPNFVGTIHKFRRPFSIMCSVYHFFSRAFLLINLSGLSGCYPPTAHESFFCLYLFSVFSDSSTISHVQKVSSIAG